MTRIEQHDIRVGDRVAYTQRDEGVVREVACGRVMRFETGESFTHAETWELIERPKPEAKLGSVWVDPEGVVASRIVYSGPIFGYLGESGFTLDPKVHAHVIARLVPAEEQA